MHRLLVPTAELSVDTPQLPKEAANHLKVLRPKDGEEIELFDGKGKWRVFRYANSTKGLKSSEGPLHLQPPPHPLTLFACVTKGSRWDWTIEKATELGATRLVPVISDRTIVRVDAKEREAKRERWTRIAEDAARQSDAKWIPEVLAPVTFAESLPLVREMDCLVGALTNPPPPLIGTALATRSAREERPLALYVGPEGDFTPDELAQLLALATPVSFGTTILRAETAAIYGLSAIKTHQDAHSTPSTSPFTSPFTFTSP